MRIGVDIDGVLVDMERFQLDYGSKFLVNNNKKINIDIFGYDSYDLLNIRKDVDSKFWNKYIKDYVKLRPREFTGEVINKLREEGNSIYIITSRLQDLDYYSGYSEDKMRRIVKRWLKKYSISYDKIIFSKESKVNDVVNNKIDVMIEDSVKNMRELGKFTKIICFNNTYNFSEDVKYRAYSWYHVYDIIKRMGE